MDKNNVFLFLQAVNPLIRAQPCFHNSIYVQIIVSLIVSICVPALMLEYQSLMVTYTQVEHGE